MFKFAQEFETDVRPWGTRWGAIVQLRNHNVQD
jgi:hypothetical protein